MSRCSRQRPLQVQNWGIIVYFEQYLNLKARDKAEIQGNEEPCHYQEKRP